MYPVKFSVILLFILGSAQLSCATTQGKFRHRSGAYRFEILVTGKPAPTFWHRGESYLLGAKGNRYVVRVHNHSSRRVEAVVTVDGRDVLDGKPGNYDKRGYLVPAHGSVDIEGWRLSRRNVAAFRFSSVADSYAAQMEADRNVGVIGVAIFREKRSAQVVRRWPRDHLSRRTRGVQPGAPRLEGLGSTASKARKGERRSAAPAESLSDADREQRTGLGTAFGEQRHSPVRHVAFQRSNVSRPDVLLALRYNDRAGLLALGISLPRPHAETRRENWLRGSAHPFPAQRNYATPPKGWGG